MLSTGQLVKETLLMGTLSIGLPTSDVGSDGTLIYKLYGGLPYHPNCSTTGYYELSATCLAGIPEEEVKYDYHLTWATMLLVPFLLNYFASWFTWHRIDKSKKITWIACVFNVYPQLRAASVIRELWRDPKKGVVKKRKFEREMSEAEVFLEASLTTFVMTYIVRRITDDTNDRDSTITSNGRADHHLGANDALFWISFLTSFISAGLGMAKSLKIGPCRILPDKGLLGGLLTVRFILIFFACSGTLFGKATYFTNSLECSTSNNLLISTTLAFSSVTLPGLITGMIFIRHRSLLKTFLTHPSLVLLPVFTFFSFESNAKWCSSNRNSESEVEIAFSVNATCFNILFSLATPIVFTLTGTTYDSDFHCKKTLKDTLVILLVGLLLTVILLLTTRSSSCCPSSCSCAPSSTSCCPPIEFGLYLPDSPRKVFVRDQTQPNRRKEIKEEMEEEDERDEGKDEEMEEDRV